MVRRREDEVLEIIKADPLISQKEIADKLGITRSSVGVHVNNLTKKGRIIGRGYVISREDKICIIGGANIDVWGTTASDITNGVANEGSVKISVGGVGRNIAENIGKLGMQPEFMTAISNDDYGKHIQSYSLKEGVRIDKSNVFRNQKTSFFVAILNKDNKMEYGISDTSILDQITPSFINQRREEIKNCNMIIIDLNIPKNTVEYILSNFRNKTIIIDPVSVSKVEKIAPFLKDVQILMVDLEELSYLSNIEINNDEDIKKATKKVLDKGVKELVVISGTNKLTYASKEEYVIVKSDEKAMPNKGGIREAQLAGLVYGLYNELEIEETLKIAIKAGEITAEAEGVVSPWLSVENVLERSDNE